MRNVFKWHLLNQWFKFKIILQKCSSWCPLQKLLNSMATRAKNKNIFEWYLFSHWQIHYLLMNEDLDGRSTVFCRDRENIAGISAKSRPKHPSCESCCGRIFINSQSKLSVLLFWNLHILNPLLNHRVNLEFNVAKTAFKPNYYPYKKSHLIFFVFVFSKVLSIWVEFWVLFIDQNP